MSELSAYEQNPLLSWEWVYLVRALELLLGVARDHRSVCLQTHTHKHGLRPSTSPYVQFRHNGTGGWVVEVSGNLVVRPELDALEVAQMEYFGWTRPEVNAGDFEAGAGGNPNFSRDIDDATPKEVAWWIVTTLYMVYGVEKRDFFAVEIPFVVTMLAEANFLARLTPTKNNPFGYIFCLPGQHIDMTDPATEIKWL